MEINVKTAVFCGSEHAQNHEMNDPLEDTKSTYRILQKISSKIRIFHDALITIGYLLGSNSLSQVRHFCFGSILLKRTA